MVLQGRRRWAAFLGRQLQLDPVNAATEIRIQVLSKLRCGSIFPADHHVRLLAEYFDVRQNEIRDGIAQQIENKLKAFRETSYE